MKELFIKSYIDKLTINDIKSFSSKNNINFSDEEYLYIYKLIKIEWKTIIFGNPSNIFENLKIKFSKEKYNKIYLLYQTYKNKYSHYL